MEKFKNLTETQVKKLAFDLGKQCLKSDVVIGLTGDLGAGKTTFIKSFAKAFGINKAKSPTFIVVSQYPLKNKDFYHIDFYRLNHMDELQALGLSDILNSTRRVAVVEWVEKFPMVKKQCDILIEFKIKSPKTRDVQIFF